MLVVCEGRCDCFGDGAAAEAGFMQDVCVCREQGVLCVIFNVK